MGESNTYVGYTYTCLPDDTILLGTTKELLPLTDVSFACFPIYLLLLKVNTNALNNNS